MSLFSDASKGTAFQKECEKAIRVNGLLKQKERWKEGTCGGIF